MKKEELKILAIGDSCKDIYVYGKCLRLAPDAPVPVLIPESSTSTNGMLGNVINNIKVFGITPDVITNENSVIKTRYVDTYTNHMFIRIDEGEGEVERIKNLDMIKFDQYDAIIISDYCKGFLEEEDIDYICDNHNAVFIDTKKIIDYFCRKALFIKINEPEYNLSRKNIDNMKGIYDSLIITLGSRGARWKSNVYPVEKVDIKDQSGAGDTFISTFMIKYLETNDVSTSITFANKCATYVVQKRGVVTTCPYK